MTRRNIMHFFDKSLVSVLSLAALTSLCGTAHAGTWYAGINIKQATDGKIILIGPAYTNGRWEGDWNVNDSEDWSAHAGLGSVQREHIGKEVSAESRGSFTVRAVWVPSYQGEPVPEKVGVLITRGVLARATHNASSSSSISLEAEAGGSSGGTGQPSDGVRIFTGNPSLKSTDRERISKELLTFNPRQEGKWENGRLVMERAAGSVSGKAKITIGTRPNSYPNSPAQPDDYIQVQVYPWGDAKPDNRTFSVTSSIEPSYKKSTSLPSDLSKLRPSTPANTNNGNGPWAVLCERNGTGAMEVHSAAKLNNEWRGHLNVYALAQGFTPSSYTWSVGGGSSFFPAPTTYDWSLDGSLEALRLGGDVKGNGMTRSSTFTATTNGALTATETYRVNWHLPVENIEEYGTPVKSYSLLPGAPRNGYPMVVPPGETTQVVLPPSLAKVKLYLTTGEQVVVGVGQAVLTRGASVLAGTATAISSRAAAATMLGWFYTLEMSDAVNATAYGFCTNDEQEWGRAVSSTRDFINGVDGADARITPSDIALGEVSSTEWLSCTMTAWTRSSSTVTLTKGDEYDSKGYVGVAKGQLHEDKHESVVGCYQYDGRPPTLR